MLRGVCRRSQGRRNPRPGLPIPSERPCFTPRRQRSLTPAARRLACVAAPAAYASAPATPRVVLVSSAGVTRPNRPGIDVEKEPPAVRMNDMLGGILTYKLAGELSIDQLQAELQAPGAD